MGRQPGRLLVAGLAVLLLALPSVGRQALSEPSPPGALNVGFTFSRRQADSLDLSWQETFEDAMDLGPTVLRLGAYFDSIEREPGEFDFSSLDWLVDHTPAQSSVVLTVGMKAPRWPEY